MQFLNWNFLFSLNDGQEEDFQLMKAEIYKANPVFHDLYVIWGQIKSLTGVNNVDSIA